MFKRRPLRAACTRAHILLHFRSPPPTGPGLLLACFGQLETPLAKAAMTNDDGLDRSWAVKTASSIDFYSPSKTPPQQHFAAILCFSLRPSNRLRPLYPQSPAGGGASIWHR